MNEIIRRLTSPTPKFFKNLIKLGLSIGAAGAAILLLPVTPGIPKIDLPPLLEKAGEVMAIIGAVATAVSKLTVDDKAIKEKNK